MIFAIAVLRLSSQEGIGISISSICDSLHDWGDNHDDFCPNTGLLSILVFSLA